MVTKRAAAYLAGLEREAVLPVAEVAQIIEAAGVTPPATWLDFHDEFAGYCESLGGGEMAVWGLAFARERTLGGEPRTVLVTRDRNKAPEFIACADVHPSFDYLMGVDGHFIGSSFPAARFSVKVERNALMWEFGRAGPVQRMYDLDGVSVLELREQLVGELSAFLVPEASDSYARYYASPDKVLLESLVNTTVKLLVRRS
jgi:hypothetical protein